MTLTLLLAFAMLLVIGAPIAVALGLSSAVTIVMHGLPASVLLQRAVNSIDSSPLLAVPMFIMAAALLSATGVTTYMFDLVRMIVGRLRGGMAHVNVLLSLVFAGMSGAALADIGALGGMQVREMEKQGYTRRFAAGLTIASATIGPIFPPSIPLIIFATAAEVSPVKLLLAGIVPALLLAGMLMGYIALIARRQNLPRDPISPTLPAFLRLSLISAPALMTPVLLIGGLLSGYFGPTEAAGITVAYAIVIGLLVYRTLTLRKLIASARETVLATANILFVVAAAALFAWVLTMDQVPARAGEWLLGISDNPLVLLLILNVVLLVAGMFLESIAAILIIAPIVTPALIAAGAPPEQIGVVMVLNLMIGLLTPPVGMSLYMMSITVKIPFAEVVRGVAPFFAPLFLALALVTLFPGLTAWLPTYLME
ncbi:TRAP transporter large permease subunit [Frigidibacter albus]|uniref:TRAP transporter large permease protein n=1 Tax=Frigidibacter albus TaxID=1465486 RepID=A0A6L8VBG8_9RHOB|nr:TRAP transporter large permease [Frigidibacter albus]MZQ87594.1 TRAP transporter large permease subunit [Frigidibacter albus]NBE29500.1 TRAP transporter large permease subunit [Frigidibacter albus]GGH44487.1 ABC transporter permease [Frigidibacter albus]